jgi:hypothetical protein
MKIDEIITEGSASPGKMRANVRDSLPGANDWPGLNQNNDAYKQYRFGIACAAAPDDQVMTTSTHQNLVTIGYTSADEEILDVAAKVLGVQPHRLNSRGSNEQPEINRQSVVSTPKKNKYGV